MPLFLCFPSPPTLAVTRFFQLDACLTAVRASAICCGSMAWYRRPSSGSFLIGAQHIGGRLIHFPIIVGLIISVLMPQSMPFPSARVSTAAWLARGARVRRVVRSPLPPIAKEVSFSPASKQTNLACPHKNNKFGPGPPRLSSVRHVRFVRLRRPQNKAVCFSSFPPQTPTNANDLPNSKDASSSGHNFDHFPHGRRSVG